MIILMNEKPYNLPGSRCNEKQLKKSSLILLVSSPWHWSALFNLSNHRFPRVLWWFYSSLSFLCAFVDRLKQINKPWCQASWLLGRGSSEMNALICRWQMPGVSCVFPLLLGRVCWHPCSPYDLEWVKAWHLAMVGWMMSSSLRLGLQLVVLLGSSRSPRRPGPLGGRKLLGACLWRVYLVPSPTPSLISGCHKGSSLLYRMLPAMMLCRPGHRNSRASCRGVKLLTPRPGYFFVLQVDFLQRYVTTADNTDLLWWHFSCGLKIGNDLIRDRFLHRDRILWHYWSCILQRPNLSVI